MLIDGLRTPRSSRGQREKFCVFNVTRQAFLSFGVSVADTQWTRMRGLLGRLRLRTEDGLWVVPSQGIHSIGLMFPIDVVYLDSDSRVVHVVEHFRPFRVGPLRMRSHSVLELPTRSLYWSNTQIGDELLICPPADLAGLWRTGCAQAAGGGQVMVRGHARDPDQVKSTPNGHVPVWLKRWFTKFFDRRDARRSALPGLAAYYWEGGAPTGHEVLNLSDTGAYIRTATEWYPGTIIELTLQHHASPGDKPVGSKVAVNFPCRVVRAGSDGVGVRFLFTDSAVRKQFRHLLAAVKAGRAQG